MKIVLFSFLFEPELGGGAAVVLNQLVRALIMRAYSVTVVTTWDGKKVKTEYVDGVKIIRIPSMNLYWVAEKDFQSTVKKIAWQLIDIWNPMVYFMVRRILLKEAPDIVHSHKLRGLSPSIWSASKAAGVKKIIHTCHDYELLSPEGFFMGWAGRLAEKEHPVIRPYQFLRRYFSQDVHTVTAPSKFVLDYHRKMGYFSVSEKKVIPNSHGLTSAELNQCEDKVLQKSEPRIRFLYLGRLEKVKGVDLLLDAFSQFSGGSKDYLLQVVGWGSLDGMLREKYAAQNNIVFAGAVFGAQKNYLIRNSDVLIAPSISPEPFGIVIVEAYAQGIPVITSRAGAFTEIVREGETGFLISTGSVDELRSVLAKISSNYSLLKKMSEHCVAEAKKYTLEKIIGEYLSVYEDKGNERKF